MKSKKKFSAIILFLMTYSTVYAQQVDIGLFQKDQNILEVRLIPSEDFKGMVSNVAFTIRWDADSINDLGAIEQTHPEKAYLPMVKSGDVAESNDYKYQVFAGFGMNAMDKFGAQWSAGNEVVLMTVAVNGDINDFKIVNDEWTDDIKNNGSFYISWGGRNATGIIYHP